MILNRAAARRLGFFAAPGGLRCGMMRRMVSRGWRPAASGMALLCVLGQSAGCASTTPPVTPPELAPAAVEGMEALAAAVVYRKPEKPLERALRESDPRAPQTPARALVRSYQPLDAESWTATTSTPEGEMVERVTLGLSGEGATIRVHTSAPDASTTVFDPPLVLMPPVLARGATHSASAGVVIHALDQPSAVRERGTVSVTTTYRGVVESGAGVVSGAGGPAAASGGSTLPKHALRQVWIFDLGRVTVKQEVDLWAMEGRGITDELEFLVVRLGPLPIRSASKRLQFLDDGSADAAARP